MIVFQVRVKTMNSADVDINSKHFQKMSDSTSLPYYPDVNKEQYYLPDAPPSSLEQMFKSVRLSLMEAYKEVSAVIEIGQAHTEGIQ